LDDAGLVDDLGARPLIDENGCGKILIAVRWSLPLRARLCGTLLELTRFIDRVMDHNLLRRM
jgi:hypothetical protein